MERNYVTAGDRNEIHFSQGTVSYPNYSDIFEIIEVERYSSESKEGEGRSMELREVEEYCS